MYPDNDSWTRDFQQRKSQGQKPALPQVSSGTSFSTNSAKHPSVTLGPQKKPPKQNPFLKWFKSKSIKVQMGMVIGTISVLVILVSIIAISNAQHNQASANGANNGNNTSGVQIVSSGSAIPDCISGNTINIQKENNYYQCTVTLNKGQSFAISLGSTDPANLNKQVVGVFDNPQSMQNFMSRNHNLLAPKGQTTYDTYHVVELNAVNGPETLLVVLQNGGDGSQQPTVSMVTGNTSDVENQIKNNWDKQFTLNDSGDKYSSDPNAPAVSGDVFRADDYPKTLPTDAHFN